MNRLLAIVLVAVSVVFDSTPLAAQPNFDIPKALPIDAGILRTIEGKIDQLQAALLALPKSTPIDIRADVEIYLKAAEWMVRHGEYYANETPKQTLAVLDAGIARARAAADGKTPWREIRGKPVIRGNVSPVDGSIQPVSILIPADRTSSSPGYAIEVILHGRDGKLTEVKFIAGKENAKSNTTNNRIQVEVYGRGNNAYRWAGEQDVYEAIALVRRSLDLPPSTPVLLRGFSMGGAGTWHIGLHNPSAFAAISPGAGFTTTHGYIKNLKTLPDYQERCLRIYDAVNYAENVFHVPTVAYSGEIDPQKAAADHIEAVVKTMKDPVRFVHLVAPGLEHKQPPEWLAKIESEFDKHLAKPRPNELQRVRFVTHTLRYATCDWVQIEGLDRHYDRSLVDAIPNGDTVQITTQNITRLKLNSPKIRTVIIDGTSLSANATGTYVKVDGRWTAAKAEDSSGLRKRPGLQGPIDDVFHTPFRVVGPTSDGVAASYAKAALARFENEWDKYFRGRLPKTDHGNQSVLLFGDPVSNPEIQKLLPKLPITWTAEKLIVNNVEYDARTHVPVLIYPHPELAGRYVVLNSGHTFRAADLNGTNALLYPRLGDWAVLKPNPTKTDPAAAEVVAAGIFDENWQFAK